MAAKFYDAEIDGIYYRLTGNEAAVTFRDDYYNSYSGTVAIPESVVHDGKTYRVTGITDWAFCSCRDLTSVTIPESVTSLGHSVFAFSSSIASITIGNSVRSIHKSTFKSCISLTSVTIPESVQDIAAFAFAFCGGLRDIYCRATTPPAVDEDAFNDYSKTLHVPAASVDAYKANKVWKRFRNIVPIK